MTQSASTEDVVDLASYRVAEDSIIAFLVRNGADPNAQDDYGSTPLHFAAMRDNECALLDLLCMRGVKIEARDMQNMTALHLAATHDNKECCRLLILKKAELRVADDENSTPLHMAATEGNTDVVKMLFSAAEEKGGWVAIQDMISDVDQESNTALHLAVENGHLEVVQLCLEKNANVNKPRQNFVTPLHLAAISGKINIVKLLVEHNARINALDGDQATPLHRATAYDNDEVIEYLVKKGARLEKADKDNFTALLIAASNGHVNSLKVLIKLHADITVTDKYERTALHWAAQEDQPAIIKALLNNKIGAELLDANDRYGNTPLHIAAQKGYMECVKLLLEFNADIEDKNDEEQTPLHLAAQSGMTHIVKWLTHVDKTTINDYDENSNTPLHLAALEGHTKVASVLLERGADIAARNCTLWTPIDCAAAQGRMKMIRCLIDYDSPIDPTDRRKTTPLHLACKRGHAECVSLLIEKGADVTIANSDGFNCMDLAIDNANKDVVQAIINSDKWFEAMKHAYRDMDDEDGVLQTPMRKLIRKMPDMAESVFHKCTTTSDHSPENSRYSITFNYELLDDQYASWESEEGSSRSGESSIYGGSVYGDDDRVLEEAQAYSTKKSVIKRNHPMLIMVRSAREDLLAHPLVTSLLRHKWHTVGRYFYYFNLILYLVFLIFITGFALSLPAPIYTLTNGYTTNSSVEQISNMNNSCAAQNAAYDSMTHTAVETVSRTIFVDIGFWVSIAVIAVKLVSEVLQLINAKLSYFGYENLLEWILYVTSLLFVIPFKDSCYHVREQWQYETGTVAVFLAWMELILIIRKLPRFGIYVVMFTHILSTFMQFFIVFFLFLVGFAISFNMLLSNQPPFSTVGNSLLKTAIMMIGEFEFDTIFNDDVNATFYPVASYIIFIIFAIVMSILIMNLLVGLAVDDIKGVQEQAVLTRYAMQVELALTVESMLPEFIIKKRILKCLKIKPNKTQHACIKTCCPGGAGAVLSGMDTENLAAALNPELDDIEKVMEVQEKMKAQISKLNIRSKELRAQNAKMESMMQALLNHHNIDFTDVDQEQEVDIDIGNVFK
ncbi:transient receptor potential cation channel subfamily A member 1 homolog isoform X2 [Watersipora subatra]|uniref:transient receptor potential cation channel subfamily A member 1 homolog isoform X2 n=1 Tax=Watersipora subatra TaxID=2589382 RepID=UPI00355B6F49